MDALVMCGGEGSRLRAGGVTTEKPLLEVGGQPMLDRIHAALLDSRVDAVHAAVSPAAPATREHVRDLDCSVIETPGAGYVADLDHALDRIGRPALTVAADLPLLTAELVNRVLAVAEHLGADRSLTVCVPVALKRRLGASIDTTISAEAVEDAVLLSGVPRTRCGAVAGNSASTDDAGSMTHGECGSVAHGDFGLVDDLAIARDVAPAGVNVVADSGNAMWLSHDVRFAVNVNRPADRELAAQLCP